ncbi:hypothetical protein [Pseudothermotoga thermarum]|uniref:Uncharacterized protein n=1 Tax=Pseudothermotoga thermarum DSM 5069 TaxID=688269 RepID=F7YVW2_9THEM|nr:hypothetical protein [Pseudothermotoga thermarum]AEH51784.1 hypothetical protein Theth_1740 [Pseudothermotoga thermarum DSM 5069]
MLKLISNLLFFAGAIVLLFAILSFELGLRAMKNKEEEKMKGHNRRGWKAVLICSIMFGLSLLIALLI